MIAERMDRTMGLWLSARFFFSCKARFFAGLFFDVFFPFFFMERERLKQLQPA